MATYSIHDNQLPLGITALPNGGSIAPIGEVVLDIRNGFPTSQYRDDHGIPHLRPMNISRKGRIVLEDVKYVKEDRGVLLHPGDVLFNNTNSAKLVGKTAVIDIDQTLTFSNHMTRLRPAVGISGRFLAYQLHYLWMSGYFERISTQHVNQASISSSRLRQTFIAVPPPEEQLRIVTEADRHLSRLDEAEEALERTAERIEQYRRVVLARAVSGKLVSAEATSPKDDGYSNSELPGEGSASLDDSNPAAFSPPQGGDSYGDLPTLPPRWVYKQVRDVGDVRLGRQRSPKHARGDYPTKYLRVANVFDNRIYYSDVLEMNFTREERAVSHLESGDILLNEGQSVELVGRAAMFRGEMPELCFQNTLIRFRASEGVIPGYALAVFRHYFYSGQFSRIARWSTNIAHLGGARFAALPFPLPPVAEQVLIAAEVERLMQAIGDQSRVVKDLQPRLVQLRGAIMRKALTGHLSSRAASDTPADHLLERVAADKLAAAAVPRR